MSGSFDVPIPHTAVTVQLDICEVTAHASRPCIPLGFELGNSTEVGDAMEEQLIIVLKSGQTTSGSGGSAATPVNTEPGGASAGAVAEVFNTTPASAGTIVEHGRWTWNVRGPLSVLFTDEQKKLMSAGRRFTLSLIKTPADSLDIGGSLSFQELGS
jgi:hypothetical protein